MPVPILFTATRKSSLEAAARAAILALPVDSPERAALSKALEQPVAPAKKLRMDKLHKYGACVAHHDAHCYCGACSPAKFAEAARKHRELQAAGLIQVWSYKEAFERKVKSSEALRNQLKKCRCGHYADRHEEDDMSNLLDCRDCACDHFAYGAKHNFGPRHVNGHADPQPEPPAPMGPDNPIPPCAPCAAGDHDHCLEDEDDCICPHRFKK